MSGLEIALVVMGCALALESIILGVHIFITRSDAKAYRDAVRTLGDTERDRDKYKAASEGKDPEIKSLKASAEALSARVTELEGELKEKRREALEHAPDDQLLDDVDDLFGQASGRRKPPG